MSSNVRPESMERITTPALANAFIAQQKLAAFRALYPSAFVVGD